MANTESKTPRITKAMRFADIRAYLMGEDTPNKSSVDDLLAFVDSEVALLAKKNTAKSGKMTATQKENEGYKALILDFLANQSEGVTCTEIAKGIEELNGFNNQKISALMRSLTYDAEKNPAGLVDKSVVKGKSLFTLR